MRKAIMLITIMLALMVVAPCLAQQRQTVSFDYDANGNRTSRDIRVEKFDGNKGDGTGDGIFSSVDEVFREAHISVFPNPTKDEVTVRVKYNVLKLPMQVAVLTQDGEVIEMHTVEDDTTTIGLDNYAAGVYILVVEVKGKTQSWRIIKN